MTGRPASAPVRRARPDVPIDTVEVGVYTIPTDRPEADGTLEWRSTTMVVCHVHGGGEIGLGFSYAAAAAGDVIHRTLVGCLHGLDAMNIAAAQAAMSRAVRNLGHPGVGASAIAAVDIALWDLKARLLGVPAIVLLGAVREAVPVYGSGGFTSYSDDELEHQLAGWVSQGIRSVKMKVGRDAAVDRARVALARGSIGPAAGLFVDANGAYDRKVALAQADAFAAHGVSWFEEPVSSDDLDGLRLLRDGVPPGIEIAAGEYGDSPWYFRRLLESGGVDVLQADATRCGGFTGFLAAAALCDAWKVPLSAHTAPALHAHVGCAASRVRHVEYFHDHVRIERMLFDGLPTLTDGCLRPDRTAAGLGLSFKDADAGQFAVR